MLLLLLATAVTTVHAQSREYDVQWYQTEMTVSYGWRKFYNKTRILIRATEDDVREITLDARGMKYPGVSVHNQRAKYRTTDSTVTILLPWTLDRNDSVVLSINHETEAPPGVLWNDTLLSTFGSTRSWLPCSLHDSAILYLALMAPSRFTAIGPGVPVENITQGEMTQWDFHLATPSPTSGFGFILRRTVTPGN